MCDRHQALTKEIVGRVLVYLAWLQDVQNEVKRRGLLVDLSHVKPSLLEMYNEGYSAGVAANAGEWWLRGPLSFTGTLIGWRSTNTDVGILAVLIYDDDQPIPLADNLREYKDTGAIHYVEVRGPYREMQQIAHDWMGRGVRVNVRSDVPEFTLLEGE